MLREDYVSLETAELLKEKGFNWEVHRSYLVNDNCFAPADVNDLLHRKDAIRIPTLQMAMKWLREEHYIFIYITPSLRYWGSDHKWDKEHPWFLEGYQPHVFHGDNPHEFRVIDKYYVPTYKEACEAAIKYCLQNLI